MYTLMRIYIWPVHKGDQSSDLLPRVQPANLHINLYVYTNIDMTLYPLDLPICVHIYIYIYI